ncbi:MAG: toxin-antitoxin system YwqK family antitoxin [Bacteroidales bacterium]
MNNFLHRLIVAVCFITGTGIAVNAQTFELYRSDTINRTDASNFKQGRWIEFFSDSQGKIEKEGYYEDNRKTGVWKTYYPTGMPKSEITYKNNLPDGFAKIYYENGKISEEGIWKGSYWVGDYTYYYPSGLKAYEWKFSESGKRSGIQKYYYESGKLLIKGEWKDGKENGTITEFYEDGSVRSEKNFKDGQFDVESSKYYAEKKVTVDEIPDNNNATIEEKKPETNNQVSNSQTFDGNGYHKLYNAFKKIDREGDFKNGQLLDGKRYYYNSDGQLIKTVVYKNGTVVETIREN